MATTPTAHSTSPNTAIIPTTVIYLVSATGRAATTTLAVTLGPCSRTFLIAAPVARHFTAPPWSVDVNSSRSSDSRIAVDLAPHIPGAATWPREECETHLEALHSLLRAMHEDDISDDNDDGGYNPKHDASGTGPFDMDVDTLWRLGRLQPGLRLSAGWVARLRRGMKRFVEGLGRVGGWMDRGSASEGHTGGRGGAATTEVLERAAEAFFSFGWAEYFGAVIDWMAYICHDEEDEETGARIVLVGPDGRRVCQGRVKDAITATRACILDRVFAAAQRSLLRWTIGIGWRPCTNMTCNTNRIAAINVFLLWSGLYPRSKLLSKSLSEIVSGLQYITATDAELREAPTEKNAIREHDRNVGDRPLWAVRIREDYGGTCTKCKETVATSMLFPLEDLLCDISFEVRGGLEG
ncbi:hypothetical protein VTH82DRAFT_4779 [Thermothelomyces myriococcoides]